MSWPEIELLKVIEFESGTIRKIVYGFLLVLFIVTYARTPF